MTNEEKKKIYAALAAPFPEEAVERSDARTNGKGYSTTGIRVQWVIDRLTAVLGIGGWRAHREVTVKEITTSSGRKMYEGICDLVLELGEWSGGKFDVFAESVAYGSHLSHTEGDAKKGAFSGALKRAAAMHGCGAAAYRGELEEEYFPPEATTEPAQPTSPAPAQVRAAPPIAAVLTPRAAPPQRHRLTSKQLAAIWALGRRLGHEQQALRQFVKTKFGAQPEFLTRDQASHLISAMSAQAGNEHDSGEQREPGMEG